MPERYTLGAKGWVAQSKIQVKGKNGALFEHVSYWRGQRPLLPFHSFESLDNRPALFPSKAAVIEAARSAWGRGWKSHVTPIRAADAEREHFDKWVQRWLDFCKAARISPGNRWPDNAKATRYENQTGQLMGAFRVTEMREAYEYAQATQSP